MKQLTINRIDFDLAFEISSYETTAYLDTESGAVVFIDANISYQLDELLTDEATLEAIEAALKAKTDLSDIEREQLMDAARVEADSDNRYRMIPKQDSREGYRDMQAYIGSLEDDQLREVLEVAIRGSGAFRRFKEVLHRYLEAQKNWFAFKNDREQQRILNWLESEGIEPEFV
jgi:hypothetical protein